MLTGYECSYMLGSRVEDCSQTECVLQCVERPECLATGFRPLSGSDLGECALVMPSTAQPLTTSGWKYSVAASNDCPP